MSTELPIVHPELGNIPQEQVALVAYQEWFRHKFRLEPSSSLDLYSEYYKIGRAIPAEKRSFKDAVLLHRLLEIDSRQKINGSQRLVDILLQDKDKINQEMAMVIASEINLPEFLEYKRQFGGLVRVLTRKVSWKRKLTQFGG